MSTSTTYVSYHTRHLRTDLRARLFAEAERRKAARLEFRTVEDVLNDVLALGLDVLEANNGHNSRCGVTDWTQVGLAAEGEEE